MRHPRSRSTALLLAVVALGAASGACGPGVAGRGSSPAPGASAAAGATANPGASASPGTSATAASVIPLIIGSQQKGPSRFVFSFLDPAKNVPVGSPDRTASVAFIPPGSSEPGAAVPATFVWAIEGSRGDYVAYTDFPAAGAWTAVFITEAPGKAQEAIGVGFDVVDKLPVIGIGDKAPASKTPTAADVGGDLAQISTDTAPDPAFYRLSVADAVGRGTPFLLVFATPAFCRSAQCGPTLDRVKKVAATAPADVAFINVEPYRLAYADGRLQPVLDASNQLQPVDAVNDWGLLSEPWIFAVDRQGVVRASFEGVASDQELRDAIELIASS